MPRDMTWFDNFILLAILYTCVHCFPFTNLSLVDDRGSGKARKFMSLTGLGSFECVHVLANVGVLCYLKL